MAAMIRPSLILKMDLDERVHSEDVVAEIKRSYSYVAPSMVASHAAGEGRPENVMRFMVKLHKPYWDANDPTAQELWEGVMPKWLLNMFAKVSNTIVASNKVRADQGMDDLAYAWAELEFGGDALLAVKTAADSSIPEQAVELVERARDFMAGGALGGEIACVRMPSRASLEAQMAVALAEAEPATEGAAPKPLALDVDYTVWGIELVDGMVRSFDSSTGKSVA